jgi:hypothetical protein
MSSQSSIWSRHFLVRQRPQVAGQNLIIMAENSDMPHFSVFWLQFTIPPYEKGPQNM